MIDPSGSTHSNTPFESRRVPLLPASHVIVPSDLVAGSGARLPSEPPPLPLPAPPSAPMLAAIALLRVLSSFTLSGARPPTPAIAPTDVLRRAHFHFPVRRVRAGWICLALQQLINAGR